MNKEKVRKRTRIEEEMKIKREGKEKDIVSITPDIFILKMTHALWRQNTFTLNDSRPLAPKYSEYFTGSAPPTLYS
jgi:hypothetical protein